MTDDPAHLDALHARVRRLAADARKSVILGSVALVEHQKGVTLLAIKKGPKGKWRFIEMKLTDSQAFEVGKHLSGIYDSD